MRWDESIGHYRAQPFETQSLLCFVGIIPLVDEAMMHRLNRI